MNDTILAALITAAVTVLVVIVGWYIRRRRVRLLLRQECDKNIAALTEFWNQVTSAAHFLPQVGYSPDELNFHQLQRLVSVPVPVWNHHTWDSQAGQMPMTLSSNEYEQAQRLYADLDAFTKHRDTVQEALNDPEARKLSEDFTAWMAAKQPSVVYGRAMSTKYELQLHNALHAFYLKVLPYWNECYGVYNRAHNGNPIQEDDVPFRRVAAWFKRMRRRVGLAIAGEPSQPAPK